MDVDEIIPQLFVGSCPTDPDEIDQLKQDFDISAVLNLQTDEDFDAWNIDWSSLQSHYKHSGIEIRRVPVRDFSPDTLRILLPSCVHALQELLDENHRVLVHCNAGVNRSPSTVIAYLHWIEGWDLDEAAAHVTRCRNCDPYVDTIKQATDDRMR